MSGVLCDGQIRFLAAVNKMIEPFDDCQLTPGVISSGVSSYGYDLRLGNRFKVLDNYLAGYNRTINPKKQDWHTAFSEYQVKDGETILIPPNSFCLAESREVFTIPRDILVIVVGKSTYARCGILVNITPLEPEWKGKITMEISNTTPLPAEIYAGEGIAQAVFFRGEEVCERSYADKKGKYNHQTGLTMPRVNQ